jgi:hypothetical protein
MVSFRQVLLSSEVIMKYGPFSGAIVVLMLAVCTQDKQSPPFLTILKPHNYDTLRTQISPVEGKTYPGARVTIGFDQNRPDTTLVPDDTGRFVGMYTIPTNETNDYSLFITASFEGLSITESRTVHYIQQP